MRRFLEFLLSSFEEIITLRLLLLAVATGLGVATGLLSIAAAVLTGGDFPSTAAVGAVVVMKVVFYAFSSLFGFGALRILFQPEESDIWSWAAVIGAPALYPVLRAAFLLGGQWLPQGCLWTACLVLLGMQGAGLWLFRAWRINQWAAELQELAAENAMRRAERDAEILGSGD